MKPLLRFNLKTYVSLISQINWSLRFVWKQFLLLRFVMHQIMSVLLVPVILEMSVAQ